MYSLRPVFILYTLLTGGQGLTNQIFWSGNPTCNAPPTLNLYTTAGTCTPALCSSMGGLAGTQTNCPTSFPGAGRGASIQVWSTSTTCSGQPDSILVLQNDTCSGYWSGATVQLNCAGSGSITDCGAAKASCVGCPSKPATKTGVCVAGNPTTSFTIASYIFTCPSGATLLGASWLMICILAFVFA